MKSVISIDIKVRDRTWPSDCFVCSKSSVNTHSTAISTGGPVATSVSVIGVYVYKGIARTQSPTIKNYAFELPTFGVIVGVSPTLVQWRGLTLEEPPSWSRLTSTPGKYASQTWAQPINQLKTKTYQRTKLTTQRENLDCTSNIYLFPGKESNWTGMTGCCRESHHTDMMKAWTSAAILGYRKEAVIVTAHREIRNSQLGSSPYTEIFSKRRKIYSICVERLSVKCYWALASLYSPDTRTSLLTDMISLAVTCADWWWISMGSL
jgi:hypothetical protein